LTLDDLGNIGEFASAVAVVISLLYLAVQIRQNTSAVRSAQHDATNSKIDSINASLAQGEHMARIYREAAEDFDKMSSDDKLKFIAHANRNFRLWEYSFYQHEDSRLHDEIWRGWSLSMHRECMHPGMRRVWSSSAELYGDRFRAFVESELINDNQTPAV
jgi:hypothetical protein